MKRKCRSLRGSWDGVSVRAEGTNKFSTHNDTIKVSCGSVHTISRGQRGAEGGS